PAFGTHVEQQLALIDRLAAQASEQERQHMTDQFTHSCRYEFLFWDQAYHETTWPVSLAARRRHATIPLCPLRNESARQCQWLCHHRSGWRSERHGWHVFLFHARAGSHLRCPS